MQWEVKQLQQQGRESVVYASKEPSISSVLGKVGDLSSNERKIWIPLPHITRQHQAQVLREDHPFQAVPSPGGKGSRTERPYQEVLVVLDPEQKKVSLSIQLRF